MKLKCCAKCGCLHPLSMFAPHKSCSDGKYSYCRVCVRLLNKQYYEKNSEAQKARSKKYREDYPYKAKLALENWRVKNKDSEKQYRIANAKRISVRSREWLKANRDKARVTGANRRAAKLKATPSWANHFFIAEAYHLAKVRERVCGGEWHVDHIVPLKSKLVCGLHCEANLQVIPGSLNKAKSNVFWPEMPD